MNPVHLAQAADPTPVPRELGGGNTPVINFPTVNWDALVPQILQDSTDAMGTWLQTTLHKTFDGVWSGDHNVIGQTPLALTWNLGPVHAQLADVQTASRAILIFALILLGLRSMLGALVNIDVLREFTSGILGAVILVASFSLLVPMGIDLVNQAAGAVAGNASLQAFTSAGGSAPDPLVGGILFLILLFFALRLLVKAAWRIMFLAVLLPVGMAACALYAVPQTRWLLFWWARLWGGMLLAQIPSVFALAIGLGTYVGGGGGIGSFLWSIAALQLATDVYGIIPFGHAPGENSPLGAVGVGPRTAGSLAWVGGKLAGTAAAAPLTNRQVQSAFDYGYR